MKEKEIKEWVTKGHILTRVIVEMAGNPKEHVEESLKKYVDALKEDPDYIFMKDYYAPAEENDGVWSTFYESEVLVANFEKLNILSFNLGPASIEILEPESFNITQKQMTDWYNDLLSKIHEVSVTIKNLTSENQLLKVNLNKCIKNCIILALNEPKTMNEVVAKVGIDKEHLQPFMDSLVKEKNVVLEHDKYRLQK